MTVTFLDQVRQIIDAAAQAGVTLRLSGSWAVYFHCPQHQDLATAFGRTYHDADFAAYSRDNKRVSSLLNQLDYVEDRQIYIASEGGRAIFTHPTTSFHIDIFYDSLNFCHELRWQSRLEVDQPTIPLAELLLSKMQIVQINEKDFVDTILLFLEHPLKDSDEDAINTTHIAKLCAANWGLWRTVTMNLEKTQQIAASYPQLGPDQKELVASRIATLRERLDHEPKPLTWRLRAQVGDRIKWYQDVDEVE